MDKQHIKIIKEVISIDGIKHPKYENKYIDISFVRRYSIAFEYLIGLNSCTKDLFEFLVGHMDDDGFIRSDTYTRNKFHQATKEAAQKLKEDISYSDSNVKKAFQKLTDRKCLIKVSKGLYKVNPEIYFQKDYELKENGKIRYKRFQEIKKLIEFERGFRDRSFELIEEPILQDGLTKAPSNIVETL
jgi:hypothetical protein